MLWGVILKEFSVTTVKSTESQDVTWDGVFKTFFSEFQGEERTWKSHLFS